MRTWAWLTFVFCEEKPVCCKNSPEFEQIVLKQLSVTHLDSNFHLAFQLISDNDYS